MPYSVSHTMVAVLRTTYCVPQIGSKFARLACGTKRRVRAAAPCAMAGAANPPAKANPPTPAKPFNTVLRSIIPPAKPNATARFVCKRHASGCPLPSHSSFDCGHRRPVRHQRLALPLDDQAVGQGLPVDIEIEDRTLEGIAQIQIAARQLDLVALGGAGRHDLARRRDNAAAADVIDPLLDPRLGDTDDPCAVLIGTGLHHQSIVEGR